jgi:quercetin dioxygenase-like cupin family protein
MAKRSLTEQLDSAVQAIIAGRAQRPMASANNHGPDAAGAIAPLVEIAAALRDLPNRDFKARLKAQIVERARTAKEVLKPTAYMGRPLRTAEEVQARLLELTQARESVSYSLSDALDDLPDGAMRLLASLNDSTVGVARFSDQAPRWKRHPEADELLHVLDGQLDVVTLTAEGPVHATVSAGSIFVCPRGLWHWPRPISPVSLLFVRPREGMQSSTAEDPHRPAYGADNIGQDGTRGERPNNPSSVIPHAASESSGDRVSMSPPLDLRALIPDIPELVIRPSITNEEAGASFRNVGSLDRCPLFISRFSGIPPWERHRTDELIHVIEGQVEVTLLTEGEPVHATVPAGSIFICPGGLWHKQYSTEAVTVFSATPTPSDISWADDPRVQAH